MKNIFYLLLLVSFSANAQEKGILFQHNLSWQAVQAKAKAQKKFIFMDCFTTWCGPCRYMSKEVFPLAETGNALNKNFISVKVQLDTTANDNAEVKSWYKAGHDIAEKYEVHAYPTYLFFDPNGKLVHRAVGSSDAATFITKANNALKPETQYYTLLAKYNGGKKDSAFLRSLANASMDAYDMENGNKIANEYFATQSNLYTETNLKMLQNFTNSSADKGFDIMLHHAAEADKVLGEGASESIVSNIILQENVYPTFGNDSAATPNWDSLNNAIKVKYPAYADEIVAKAKTIWYQHVKDWNNFKITVVNYMDAYGDKASTFQKNEFAWGIFQNCNDMACVEKALEWSKQSFAKDSVPGYIDTYANLLYKLGRKDEAIEWETKAANLTVEGDKKGYYDVIEKMKKGEKTWD